MFNVFLVKKYSSKFVNIIATFATVFVLIGCAEQEATPDKELTADKIHVAEKTPTAEKASRVDVMQTASSAHSIVKPIPLTVYKSPTCGCCQKWVDHIDAHNFSTEVYNDENMSVIKDRYNVKPNYRSCHTAVSQNGFVFEGHVPAKFIQQFLHEKHPKTVLGLSVPAMPLGSPGMEVENRFQPYQVLLLHLDGSYDIYANVKSYEEQF